MKNSMNFGIERCFNRMFNDIQLQLKEHSYGHPVYVLLLGKISQRNEKIGRREDRRRYHASALYVVVDVEVV